MDGHSLDIEFQLTDGKEGAARGIKDNVYHVCHDGRHLAPGGHPILEIVRECLGGTEIGNVNP